MGHELAEIRYRAWRCSCGHVAESRAELAAHVMDRSHILYLLPPGVWNCSRCDAVWFTESAAKATTCEVTP